MGRKARAEARHAPQGVHASPELRGVHGQNPEPNAVHGRIKKQLIVDSEEGIVKPNDGSPELENSSLPVSRTEARNEADRIFGDGIPEEAILEKDQRLGLVIDPHRLALTGDQLRNLAREIAAVERRAYGPSGIFGKESDWVGILTRRKLQALVLIDDDHRVRAVLGGRIRYQSQTADLGRLSSPEDGVKGKAELLLDVFLDLLRKRNISTLHFDIRRKNKQDFDNLQYRQCIDSSAHQNQVYKITLFPFPDSTPLLAGSFPFQFFSIGVW